MAWTTHDSIGGYIRTVLELIFPSMTIGTQKLNVYDADNMSLEEYMDQKAVALPAVFINCQGFSESSYYEAGRSADVWQYDVYLCMRKKGTRTAQADDAEAMMRRARRVVRGDQAKFYLRDGDEQITASARCVGGQHTLIDMGFDAYRLLFQITES